MSEGNDVHITYGAEIQDGCRDEGPKRKLSDVYKRNVRNAGLTAESKRRFPWHPLVNLA